MPQYTLNPSNFVPGQVGTLYNLGLSDGTNSYGYILQSAPVSSKGFSEGSDVTSKNSLIQYSSVNLIDRDFAFYPKVTQGDFSGGGLQVAFLDATKYFDSDLEIRFPGILQLRPPWTRTFLSLTSPAAPQCVLFNNDIWTVNGSTSIFNSSGSTGTLPFAGNFVDTDGAGLYASDGAHLFFSSNPLSSWTTFTNSIQVSGTSASNMWIVNLGTNGRFVYFAYGTGAYPTILQKMDINGIGNALVAVPTGTSGSYIIADLCPYATGVAILTRDLNGQGNTDVWYHDGQNMTRIARLPNFFGHSICNCLGNLYMAAESAGGYDAPALFQISSGSIQVVSKFGSPLSTQIASSAGSVIASGQYVFWTIFSPQINQVSPLGYVAVYDTTTQATSHIGNLDAQDAPRKDLPRQLAAIGRSAVFPMTAVTGNLYLQYQTNNGFLANPSNLKYASSGWMVSSKIDFQTPAIHKRFRRIEVEHAPLPANCTVVCKAFVDQDPNFFTTSLTPVPSTAIVTNNVAGTQHTILTFGQEAIGNELYFALNLQTSDQQNTPLIRSVAVSIGGTWNWDLDLDCTSTRRLLNQASIDTQGANGKDLYFLIRNAYENGTGLTIFLAGGLSYFTAVESIKANSPAYVTHTQTPVNADEEWFVTVVLRQDLQ